VALWLSEYDTGAKKLVSLTPKEALSHSNVGSQGGNICHQVSLVDMRELPEEPPEEDGGDHGPTYAESDCQCPEFWG
jgi:hypothetical protein